MLNKCIMFSNLKVNCFHNRGALGHRSLSDLLKVLLLLLWVGVVEAHDEFAFEGDLVVLVEEGCLGVADVQVPDERGTS